MLEVPRQRKSCDRLTLDKARVWLELLVGGDGRRRGFDVAHPRVRRAGRVGPYTRGNARTTCIVNSPVIGMKIREIFNANPPNAVVAWWLSRIFILPLRMFKSVHFYASLRR